ncbi:MAG: hypothetical protein IKE03_06155 [Blautia sp.]|nr:hypothetical protein [Blautia sp.]
MRQQDLGMVTAYAYAVSQGYTGTEEEFAELMASYATVADEAAESAAEAAASAEAAGTSEAHAASSAASAGQSATSAGNSAASASGSAVQAQSSATAAGQSATQAAGSATAAGNSATAAAGSASQAAASETAAGASATAAAGSATSASGSATAAAGSATEADASADRAQEILDSIPEDYSEMSEDVADLKSAFRDFGHYINGNEDILVNVGYTENSSINESGTIVSNYNAHYTDLIPVDTDEYVLWYLSDGTNNITRIHAYDANGDWIEQILMTESGTSTQPIGAKFTPGEGTKYIRISLNKVVTPIILAKTYLGENLHNAIQTLGEIVDVKQQVDLYTDEVIGAKEIINSISWVEGYSIQANGNVQIDARFHYTNPIPVKDGIYKFTYKGVGVNNNTRIHGYDANGDWVEQILLSRSETSTDPIIVEISCSGYSFIKISTAKVTEALSLVTPLLISSYTETQNSIGLHTTPESQGVVNAIKRARQMTDLEWIPGADLLRAFMDTGDTYLTSHSETYQGRFVAGQKYKGLPYSERNIPYRWIGIEVPFEAFCSAIQKANSVIANESTYTKYGADYYGCVCTSLTCYALDLPYTVSTKYNKIPGMTYIAPVNTNFDASILKLGDILQISGHCALITDIYKDDFGRITYIEISEQTRQGNSNRSHLTGEYGSVCRRITMTVQEFITWFSGFYIYRYTNIDKVGYFPCPYVPMPDEGNRICIHDYPLMPYMGNKTTYGTETAPTVKIIFDTDAYTTLVVYKNGALFGEYSIEGQTYYNVQCDTDEAKYTACLAVLDENQNISYSTQSIEWYCRPHDTPVYSVSNNTVTISVTNSGEFKPYCVIFDTTFINGGYIKLFDTDYTKTVNSNSVTYTFSVPFAYSESKSCKLYLRSDEWGVAEYNFTINP